MDPYVPSCEQRWGATRDNAEKSAPSLEEAGFIAHAVFVAEAVCEHPVAPALQDRWHAAPPQREHEKDKLGVGHPRLLPGDVGREGGLMHGRMGLLGLVMETLQVDHRAEAWRPALGLNSSAYRSETSTSWPVSCSAWTATSRIDPVNDNGPGCA